jgi:hypothetical protein
MPRRRHQPDPSQRRQVEALAAYGIPEHEISRVVAIDPKTLRKYYREELDLGETKANAQVAGFLFNSAKNGNVTAQIFWLKTRAGWRETPVELKHSGSIARKDISQLTDQEVMDRIMALAPAAGLAPIKLIEADVEAQPNGHDAVAVPGPWHRS